MSGYLLYTGRITINVTCYALYGPWFGNKFYSILFNTCIAIDANVTCCFFFQPTDLLCTCTIKIQKEIWKKSKYLDLLILSIKYNVFTKRDTIFFIYFFGFEMCINYPKMHHFETIFQIFHNIKSASMKLNVNVRKLNWRIIQSSWKKKSVSCIKKCKNSEKTIWLLEVWKKFWKSVHCKKYQGCHSHRMHACRKLLL